jgi:hypothetical protein
MVCLPGSEIALDFLSKFKHKEYHPLARRNILRKKPLKQEVRLQKFYFHTLYVNVQKKI